jgi:hypothetical protein
MMFPHPDDCFDRLDVDEETGLYPCADGSQIGDPEDCDGEGSGDEETESCRGEPCTATKKIEYYEEEPECRGDNDGALGDPVPCE